MKTICFILALLCLLENTARCQKIRPLSIGDTIPELTLHNILNIPGKSYNLADAKHKVLILDFFATWCGPCIGLLPHLDSLQQKLGDSLQVIVVDYETEKAVTNFLSKRDNPLKLPFVTADTTLSQLFPHKRVPHEVWIKDGIVKAITPPEEITAENIRKMATGKKITMSEKKDLMGFDVKRPFLENEVFRNNMAVIKSSLFTHHIEGLGTASGYRVDSINGMRRYYYINMTIQNLYRFAAGETYTPNRWIIETADQIAFSTVNNNSYWLQKYAYCYELSLPVVAKTSDRNEQMLADLNKQMGWQTTVENRIMEVWVISQKNGITPNTISINKKPKFSIPDLVNRLNEPVIGADIFINRTNGLPIYEQLPSGLSRNIPALKNFLDKKGLEITREKISLPVFVIKDINSSSN